MDPIRFPRVGDIATRQAMENSALQSANVQNARNSKFIDIGIGCKRPPNDLDANGMCVSAIRRWSPFKFCSVDTCTGMRAAINCTLTVALTKTWVGPPSVSFPSELETLYVAVSHEGYLESAPCLVHQVAQSPNFPEPVV